MTAINYVIEADGISKHKIENTLDITKTKTF